jgi:P27 family predicted phage terminase small subunit
MTFDNGDGGVRSTSSPHQRGRVGQISASNRTRTTAKCSTKFHNQKGNFPPMSRTYSTKSAAGNRGHRGLVPEVKNAAGEFEPPFCLDKAASAEWDRIIAEAHWFTETDAVALADRCLCFSRLLAAEEDISKRGHVIPTRNGKVLNPSIRVARSYREALMKYDTQLGLTPSSRTRIPDVQRDDDAIDALELKLCGDWPPIEKAR